MDNQTRAASPKGGAGAEGRPRRFYNFARDSDGERELYIDGEIADSLWFGDECTPGKFRAELFSGKGDITLWLSSPGGDCFAASQIYTMLLDYQGRITVKVYGLCASAASVIAMAGTEVLMSPTALMLIHNPWTLAIGDKAEMEKAGALLDEVKECIINAYEIKTGLSRAKLSHLMDDETPMNVHKAIALGFADGVLTDEKKAPREGQEHPQEQQQAQAHGQQAQAHGQQPQQAHPQPPNTTPPAHGQPSQQQAQQHITTPPAQPQRTTTIAACHERLNLLTGGIPQ